MARSATDRAEPSLELEQPTYLAHRQILVVLGGLMAGMMLAALDQSIVGTALPRIVGELGGLDQLSWVVTAYLLTSTAATPLWGKISDLYGRRPVFQAAIAIFLLGSVLAGLSQNMPQLIAFRALQGVGGGGLLALAYATVGDVVPPRERGRYQGWFGAVFGLANVAGPLLGGWLTDGPGWRWIFYVNLPIGLAALVVTTLALRLPSVRRERQIDWLGAGLIVAAVSALLLYLNWAGRALGWLAPASLGLIGAAAILGAIFVAAELRAAEPIIPLRLVRNRIFAVGSLFAFLIWAAMFGALIFMPLYLQAVKGMSPTQSGLALLPTVAGIFTTSISSGQLISRTGRYKVYPIVGAAVLLGALLLLAQLRVETPFWQVAVALYVFGAGLGFTMQTITVAVQNAVEPRDLGVATSGVTFFRSLGGAIGAAVFGAVLSSRLATYLADGFGGIPAGAGGAVNVNDVQAIQALPEPIKGIVLQAFTHALTDVFLAGAPFVAVALVAALFLREIPLRPAQATAEAQQVETRVEALSVRV